MVGVFYPRTSSTVVGVSTFIVSGTVVSISGTPRLPLSLSNIAHEDSIKVISIIVSSFFIGSSQEI